MPACMRGWSTSGSIPADLEADIERLEALGAEVLEGPLDFGAIRVCWMRAPDDVRIELIQQVER